MFEIARNDHDLCKAYSCVFVYVLVDINLDEGEVISNKIVNFYFDTQILKYLKE